MNKLAYSELMALMPKNFRMVDGRFKAPGTKKPKSRAEKRKAYALRLEARKRGVWSQATGFRGT
jgi:hypothetical protein